MGGVHRRPGEPFTRGAEVELGTTSAYVAVSALRVGDIATRPVVVLLEGQSAFGMRWTGDLPVGVHPEYYRKEGTNWVAIPPSEVPRKTWLEDQVFPAQPKGSFPAPPTSVSAPFTSTKWAAGPFTVALADGSNVEYVWYKFIEQPAIARLGVAAEVLTTREWRGVCEWI